MFLSNITTVMKTKIGDMMFIFSAASFKSLQAKFHMNKLKRGYHLWETISGNGKLSVIYQLMDLNSQRQQ